jgi:hypothetical protein
MEYSFIEWFKEIERRKNLILEPDNIKYWSRHSETDFFKWARPSSDNNFLSQNKN